LGRVGDMKSYDYTMVSLLDIVNFKNNINILQSIFDDFQEGNSYAIAFIINCKSTGSVCTLDGHFLVNKTTSPEIILKQVYRRIDKYGKKYGFVSSDKIIVKLRPLRFKVKDPKYPGGRIQNTPYLPTTKKVAISLKLLSSNYIPHSMDLSLYGVILNFDIKENTY